MTYVLAIEPQPSQATILRDTVGPSAQTGVTIVTTLAAALAAIDSEVPELVLASALMPPREENLLLARLRRLPRDTAPQVLIIPAFAGSETSSSEPQPLLFSQPRARPLEAASCNPSTFADQLSAYLSQVERRRYDAWQPQPQRLRLMAGSGADRRTALRFERLNWAGAQVNGTTVSLVDLSPTGAQVLAPMMLEPGGSVHVLLSSDVRRIQIEAGVVWGLSGGVGPTQTPRSRVGMSFKDFDRKAFEQFYFDRG